MKTSVSKIYDGAQAEAIDSDKKGTIPKNIGWFYMLIPKEARANLYAKLPKLLQVSKIPLFRYLLQLQQA